MEKEITYKGRKYTAEIKWSGSQYCVRVVGRSPFLPIPNDCLDDIEKIKPHIIAAFEYKSDVFQIEKWDGKL